MNIFKALTFFFDKWNCTQNTYKNIKPTCEGTLISFLHLLIVQMGKLMFIEGEWLSQDNPAGQCLEAILLTPSPLIYLLYHVLFMKHVKTERWKRKLMSVLNDFCKYSLTILTRKSPMKTFKHSFDGGKNEQ